MTMTHLLEMFLNQSPWNLVVYLAAPWALVGTMIGSGMGMLTTGKFTGAGRWVHRSAGMLAGVYYGGLLFHLIWKHLIPVTGKGAWHSWIDVAAMVLFIVSTLPFILVALNEFGVLWSKQTETRQLSKRMALAVFFLALTGLAMAGSLVDPRLIEPGRFKWPGELQEAPKKH